MSSRQVLIILIFTSSVFIALGDDSSVRCVQCETVTKCYECAVQSSNPLTYTCSNECSYYCGKNSYFPELYEPVGIISKCAFVADRLSNICINTLQFLQNTNNVTITLSQNLKGIYYLAVTFKNTPSVCFNIYATSFEGALSPQLQIEYNQNCGDNLCLSFQFSQSDVNTNQINCLNKLCYFFVYLFWLDSQQFVYKISTENSFKATIQNSFGLTGISKQISVDCTNCKITQEQTVESTLQLICENSTQNCTPASNGQQQIKTPIGSSIVIKQQVSSTLFSQNSLKPVSLKLDITLSGTPVATYTINLKDYIFDNTILGQITYTFKASTFTNGTLTVTSLINTTNNNRVLEQNNNDNQKFYTEQSIRIITFESNDNNSLELTLAALAIIVFAFAYLLNRKSSNAYQKIVQKPEEKQIKELIGDYES